MLIPRPQHSTLGSGEFQLTGDTAIASGPELTRVAGYLQAELRGPSGLGLPIVAPTQAISEVDAPSSVIALTLDPALPAEGYRLQADASGVSIAGGDPSGVFYGCQSLRQLLPPAAYRRSPVGETSWTVPAVEIEDAPRFGWRGAMLDVARHFMPKHDVLRFIDLLALHKLNLLHFHLSDDQGWRVEIRRYPRLTEVGGWRRESQVGAGAHARTDGRPHGGYYTQDDLREIVAYAADRFVTVVPEIDVPGHSRAAIAAYPELGVTGEQVEVWPGWGIEPGVLNTETSTVAFYLDVFDEILELFPSQFIGLGGDECPKDQWQADPRTQELIRDRGLANEAELQSWFVGQIAAHLTARGRRAYGWDDLLEGPLPADTVVASWRGLAGALSAARRGLDVVACPDDRVYLDYRQSELPDEPIPVSIPLTLQRSYEFDPVPPELTAEQRVHVLGGQANLWTEHMDSPRTVDYFAFPRLCAVAEVLWTSGDRDFADFSSRLAAHLPRLDAIGVEYRRESGPLPWQLRPGIPGRPQSLADRERWIAEVVPAQPAGEPG